MATTPAAGGSEAAPALLDGTELLGRYQGSGHREAPYLVRRTDGHVLQLSPLLYRLAALLDGNRSSGQVAAELSAEWGREISAEQVRYLVDSRLRPAGVATPEPGAEQPVLRGRDRLLALRFRVALVPEHVVDRIARVFQPLFHPPVVVAVLVAFVLADVWLAGQLGVDRLVASGQELIRRPEQLLLMMALLIAAGVFHECGHVAACRYGGARPGAMGVGIYLVWPAMYSTVTDAYRLGRAGRLRTDLGGSYFNALAVLVMVLVYLPTGAPWLLAALIAWQATTAWQFLPSVRLDGYYILSDLVGVPDLFDRMGPTLRSMLPGRQPHPRVRELKPWARRVIAVWVVLVIPCLAYWVLAFLVLAPHLLPGLWEALVRQAGDAGRFARAGEAAATAVALLRMVLLVLPWAGMAMVLWSLGGSFARFVRTRLGRARAA